MIYPVGSIIHFLNNWGLKSNLTCYISNTIVPRVAGKENIFKEFSRPWKIVFELKRVFQQFREEYLKINIVLIVRQNYMVARQQHRLHKPVCCSSSKNKTIRMKLGTSKACKYGNKELETGSDLM